MAPISRRLTAIVVFLLAVAGCFCYYGFSNDHFDRLARARQIAMYGDVPFRDFFDPGYFLTLYTSALMIRLFGDNLFGEFLLNVSFIAAGTTLVYILASNASRSTLVGFIAAVLVIAFEPRIYDYDKVLFYPLGLYACWRYIDQPTVKSLLFVGATTVVAALFRYDSGLYIGSAAMVGIVARHWGEWKIAARRLGGVFLVMGLIAAPALIFIQTTAGLEDAFEQVITYALQEGDRSQIFRAATIDLDWSAPSFQGVLNQANAAGWLYYVAITLPLVAALILPLVPRNRQRVTIARLLSYAVFMELVAIFILREPVAAHIGGASPLIVVGGSLLAEEWRHRLGTSRRRPVTWLIGGVGATLVLVTTASIGAWMDIPPKKNFQVWRRLVEFVQTPTALELLPKSEFEPIVRYLRDCTNDPDRILVGWFAAEIFFFGRRGFAAGLPEVFGGHWTGLQYQRRSLRMLEQQSVPIIVLLPDRPLNSYQYLWDYIRTHYDLAHDGALDATPPLQIWVQRGRPATRMHQDFALPCYAGAPAAFTENR